MIREHAVLKDAPPARRNSSRVHRRGEDNHRLDAWISIAHLDRGIEQPSRYLLLSQWARVEDHTEGFRRSPEYDRWQELLHHFYDPFPTVEHLRADHLDLISMSPIAYYTGDLEASTGAW